MNDVVFPRKGITALDKPLYREEREGWEAALVAIADQYGVAAHHRLRLLRAGQRLDELEQEAKRQLRKQREENG